MITTPALVLISAVIGCLFGIFIVSSKPKPKSIKVDPEDNIQPEAEEASEHREQRLVANPIINNKNHLSLFLALNKQYFDSYSWSLYLSSKRIDKALPELTIPFTLINSETSEPMLCIIFTQQSVFNDPEALKIINLRNGLHELGIKSVLVPNTSSINPVDVIEDIDEVLFGNTIF
ncbi:hypothetical protein H5185_12400 [Shewanella sp. SG44-6]|jgi:hypothetical protein|uniref:hypothetical protein n=1 Tax=Shewanella sp. SG44-6 TaxID=2760959 RepID=UPI0016023FEF|nr:hypothetical protein [Shewanella sp. SG44-6]MBB1390215.1 hypothetical protein [Shewanella sp. SG44-6]